MALNEEELKGDSDAKDTGEEEQQRSYLWRQLTEAFHHDRSSASQHNANNVQHGTIKVALDGGATIRGEEEEERS